MSHSKLDSVRIAGLSCAVPKEVVVNTSCSPPFSSEEIQKIAKMSGIDSRRVAPAGVCASDLCYEAAQHLLKKLQWSQDSVDALVFVSQTPDYALPATSCVLQARLGLGDHCAAFDISLGCSGYVYGLWVVSQLVASGSLKRALLLVGDTVTQKVSPEDRATALLFGDAGSATALEHEPGAAPWFFQLGTDGHGAQNLLIPAGGARQASTESSRTRVQQDDVSWRSEEDIYMDGIEISNFTIQRVPTLVRSTLEACGHSIDTIDSFLFHQANGFILKYIGKKLKLPPEKVPSSIQEFGNTSSVSIPLTWAVCADAVLQKPENKLLLVGFGVGYSWGSALIQASQGICNDWIEV